VPLIVVAALGLFYLAWVRTASVASTEDAWTNAAQADIGSLTLANPYATNLRKGIDYTARFPDTLLVCRQTPQSSTQKLWHVGRTASPISKPPGRRYLGLRIFTGRASERPSMGHVFSCTIFRDVAMRTRLYCFSGGIDATGNLNGYY